MLLFAALAMHVESVASPDSSPPVALELPRRGPALLWFGVQQPLVGLRVVLARPELRRIAAAPLVFLVTVCLLVAFVGESDQRSGVEVFYATMLSLAAVPVILFGRTYRRLAAASRGPLGLSPRDAARPS